MFANIANSLQQVAGFFPSLMKVKAGHLRHALAVGIINPRKLGRHVAAMSKYMDQRMHDQIGIMSGEIDDILLAPNGLESSVAWIAKHTYFMQLAVDNTLSPMIWLAKYNEVMETGSATTPAEVTALEKQAVELADSAVRTTQGSQRAIDISAMEAGSPFWRMFTQFTGYFNTQVNLVGEQAVLAQQLPTVRAKAQRLAMIAFVGFYASAVVGELIMQAIKGGPDDGDDDGEYLDDWLKSVLFLAPLRYATAMVPVVGTGVQALFNMTNNKPYDDRLATAPTISMLESGGKAVVALAKIVYDDEYEPKASRVIRDVGTLVTLATGVPVTPLTKALSYQADVEDDNVEPTSGYDYARGIITGKASPESK